MNQIINPEICGWDSATYLIFSDNVFGNFIYYSHVFPAIAIVILSAFIFLHNPRNLASRALIFMSVCFTLWSSIDLILWATERTDYTMFFWSILIFFDVLLYVGSLYFIYAFIAGRYPSWKQELLILFLFSPLLIFVHTDLNLTGFDFTNCDREALEGPLWHYAYIIEIFFTLWIAMFAFKHWRRSRDARQSQQILLSTVGILFLLLLFSLGNIIGSIEVNWELGQYGLFGIPLFTGLLTYLIIRYESLNIKLVSSQALIIGIIILIFSILFLRDISNVRIIIAITLTLIGFLGFLLVRSVKQEIAAKERNEQLAKDLARANSRLRELDRQKSEFVSIASHQLRSPLTSIRGYTSMLVEGSFGKLPQKALDVIGRIQESSTYMASSIEDFLNVSRIEQGRMKYENTDTNIRDMAERIVDDIRPIAIKKGLALVFRSQCEGETVAYVDPGKMRQVIYNIVDNAIKYTPKGSVDVVVTDDLTLKKISVHIKDSGVGMDEDALHSVFDKFVRAKNANRVNVTGSGLGLFVAKQMLEAMNGRVTVTSEGEGKGSTFRIELPMVR